jgi:hypothetical protein
MAAKRLVIGIFLLLAAAGISIPLLFSSQTEEQKFSADDLIFIDTYVKLSVAGEMPVEDPGSRTLARERVLEKSGVDSLWMARYAENISGDTEKQLSVWKEITGRLDSLREIRHGNKTGVLSRPPQ